MGGLDSAVKFFIAQERPDLAEIEIPIPIRIEKGSWIAEIPQHAGALIVAGFGTIATAYFTKAAQKLAENDFDGVSTRDLLNRCLKCVRWFAELSKHMRHTAFKVANLVWDKAEHAGFLNDKGEILYVPTVYLKLILAAPSSLLADLVSVVQPERSLRIGTLEGEAITETEIKQEDRGIFTEDDDAQEIVLPELIHGQIVALNGLVTRGNERTNLMGFFYDGHVLSCLPRIGRIVAYKKQLFSFCHMTGEITRLDKKGEPTERRPKIIFDSLHIIEEDGQQGFPFLGQAEDLEE